MWFNKPSSKFWFGTDDKGNSLFDAVWSGLRVSLLIAFITTTITTVIGVIVGAFWGYSKKVDRIMMEVYNIIANLFVLRFETYSSSYIAVVAIFMRKFPVLWPRRLSWTAGRHN